MTEFEPFPKIPRLQRDCVITEKIDGTNASIIIDADSVHAASRNRLITSDDDDNFGFAGWVAANAEALYDGLGEGRHFGEWWGLGIQRGYDRIDKRFSLFNTSRWVPDPGQSWGYGKHDYPEVTLPKIPGLSVVPVLYVGQFSTVAVSTALNLLRVGGSVAAPGFAKPEGVVVYHTALRGYFKQTLEGDGVPKGKAA